MTSNPHGGVLIAAKKHLQLGDVRASQNVELINATVTAGKSKIHIAPYYRPPNKTEEHYLDTVKEEISTLKTKAKNRVFIIGGDFNLPDINWKDLTMPGSQYTNRLSLLFLEMVAETILEQLVDFSTRKDNTLDIFLTTHPSFKQICKPMPSIENSDHDIVLLDTSTTVRRPKPPRRKIFLWKKLTYRELKMI